MSKILKTLCLVMVLNFSLLSLAAASSASPGVNKYAWMSSLKTINFMPLASADPFAGVIITDWYQISPAVRYKVNIYVLNGILNSQTVNVHVFKQMQTGTSWNDSPVSNEVATKLENVILNQARELRYQDS